ncbi:MAG TPA: hypothetical protein VLH39_08525, partial [Magnetospirillaceae bacterium]|nr:hypothetical protein [Magnetospirillaceae bacterium]
EENRTCPADTRGKILRLVEGLEGRALAALELVAETRERVRAGKDPSPSLARLDEADRELSGSEAKKLAGFLLPGLEEILDRPARTFEEALDRSEVVYREIRDSASYHRDLLSRP